MLSVMLTILKIIGIILLVVLGLLLTVLLIVLFVPVRYRSSGSFARTDEGFKDEIMVRATWLLHIVSITFILKDKDNKLVIKLFGKKLSLSKENKTSKDQDNNRTEAVKTERTQKGVQATEFTDNTVVVSDVTDLNKDKDKDKDKELHCQKDNVEQTKNNELKQKQIDEKALNIKETKDDIKPEKKGIKEKLAETWNKVNDICEKLKNINAVKDSFVSYLKRDESKLAIKKIKHIVFKVLKHISPQKLRARIKFGFEDPATTGNVLGAASVLYGVYGDKLELEPDFENVVLEGEYKLKGRIRVFTILVAALKLFFNKWIREFMAFSKKTVKTI